MEFKQQQGQLTQFSVAQLVTYFRKKYPSTYAILGSELNKLYDPDMPDTLHAQIGACNFKPKDVINYCRANRPAAPTLMSPDLIDVLFLKGDNVLIRPMETKSAVCASVRLSDEQSKIVTNTEPKALRKALEDEGIKPTDLAGKGDAVKVIASASIRGSPSVVVKGEASTLILPVVKGEVVIPPSLEEKAKKVYGVKSVEFKELVVVQRIVDQVKYTKGKFVSRPYRGFKHVRFSDRVWEGVNLLAADLQDLFGKYFNDAQITSVAGRDLMRRLLDAMLLTRGRPEYIEFLDKEYAEAMKKCELDVDTEIGGHDRRTLTYAQQILQGTRGIRGGDERDSTAAGLSSYLPVNLRRSMVKVLARASDVMRLAKAAGMRDVTLLGDDAAKYLDALIYTNADLDRVCGPMGDKEDWHYDEEEECYTRSDVNFVIYDMHVTIESLTINTTYRKDSRLTTGDDLVAALTDWPDGIEADDYFMPSVLVHNLRGFKTNFKCKLSYRDKLIKMSVRVNIVRTYSWFLQGARAWDIIRELGGPELDMRELKKLLERVRTVVGMKKFAIDTEGISDLSELYYDNVISESEFQQEIEKLEEDVQQKEEKVEDDPRSDDDTVFAVRVGGGIEYEEQDFV